MNSLFSSLGIESWKPFFTALALPPVPLLLLVLLGARMILPRRGVGWTLVLLGVAGMWLSACSGTGLLLQQWLMPPMSAMSFDRVRELKADVLAKKPVAITVLGAGVEPFAPEYGVSSLQYPSLERLRYGLWLARQTGAPVAFSGGVGWGQSDATPEARVAAKVAAEDYRQPIRWVEDDSHDTRENAGRTIALLKPMGITDIVLVTHAYHMPRALRDFREAAAGSDIRIEPAPIGLARRLESPVLEWIPSSRGFTQTRVVLREVLGRLAGA